MLWRKDAAVCSAAEYNAPPLVVVDAGVRQTEIDAAFRACIALASETASTAVLPDRRLSIPFVALSPLGKGADAVPVWVVPVPVTLKAGVSATLHAPPVTGVEVVDIVDLHVLRRSDLDDLRFFAAHSQGSQAQKGEARD